MREPKRILVVVTLRIGDVLLTTPLIRSFRRTWPQAHARYRPGFAIGWFGWSGFSGCVPSAPSCVPSYFVDGAASGTGATVGSRHVREVEAGMKPILGCEPRLCPCRLCFGCNATSARYFATFSRHEPWLLVTRCMQICHKARSSPQSAPCCASPSSPPCCPCHSI